MKLMTTFSLTSILLTSLLAAPAFADYNCTVTRWNSGLFGVGYLASLPHTLKFPSTEGSIHYGDTQVYSTRVHGGEALYAIAGTVTCDANQKCGISGGIGEDFIAGDDASWKASGNISDLLFNISGKGEELIPMELTKGDFLKISCE